MQFEMGNGNVMTHILHATFYSSAVLVKRSDTTGASAAAAMSPGTLNMWSLSSCV